LARSKLILLTSGFPFGGHETFLETEIKYLCEGFDQVQILAVDPTEETIRQVPDNCSVSIIRTQRGTLQKLKALSSILDPRVKAEIRIIKEVYGMSLSKGVLSTLLMSLNRAKAIEKQILPYIGEDKNTVLYSYWCDDSALALALLSEKRKALKTVCRIHGWDVYFEASKINYLPYRHLISDNLQAIFAISQKGIDYVMNTWKVQKKSVFQLARLGVHQQNRCRINKNCFILVSCSNVIPLKRVDLIVRALAEIKDHPIKWVHFGNGPKLEMVKELSKKIPSNIQAEFKGRVTNQEVLTWYKENNPHLFINVSTSEGIPVSIMEAMSFGIPVIATNVGGTKEIVNKMNGFLLEPSPEPTQIAEEICKFINLNEGSFQQFSDFAYTKWKTDFHAEKNFGEFIDKLKQ
jgi:glycosyltransferase involved in cell wall biosynthesis